MRPWPLLLLLGCGGEAPPHASPDVVFLASAPPPPSFGEPPTPVLVPLEIVSSPGFVSAMDEDADGIADPEDGETDTTPTPPPVSQPEPQPVPQPEPQPVPQPEPIPAPPVPEPTNPPAPEGEPSPADLLQRQTQAVQVRTAQQEQQVDQINDELLVIVNKLRAEKGLPPLPAEPAPVPVPDAAAAAPAP